MSIYITTKIVIIGAGPSGIAAAAKLLENGFNNVTILEAEDRIGGRVNTVTFGNYSVDLGGQWVDGQEGNVVYELANPLGLLEHSDKPDFGIGLEITDSTGERLKEDVKNNLQKFYDKYLREEQFDDDSNEFESVADYAEKKFYEEFKDNPEIFNDKNKYLRYFEPLILASVCAESWHDLSAVELNEYQDGTGDHDVNWKERGYSTILDILMKRYPDSQNEIPVLNNTILNTEVTSIDYSNNVGLPILITAANGQSYEADHVLVTVSLGVLKEKHNSLFIPPLPDYKVKTIETLGFGVIAKIYLLFEKPFWEVGDRRMLRFSFIWNDADKEIIEADPEKCWLTGVYCAMTVEHKPNLLSMWIVGQQVKIMEALPEDKVFKQAVETLHRFLDKQYNVNEPVAMLRTRWYSNPNFKGGYSYSSVESHKNKINREMLERSLNEKNLRVLFAGEATSSLRYATVDGAISSGWKAADTLIHHYTKSNAEIS